MSVLMKVKNFSLCVIYIYESSLIEIRDSIDKKIQQSPIFFKYAPIILNINYLKFDIIKKELFEIILDKGINLVGVTGCSNIKVKEKVLSLGIPIFVENIILKKKNIKSNILISSYTKIVTVPIRSGQQVYAKNQNLVVVNNVSTGAELIADGNIYVYGIMRGRIKAGASGDKYCKIFCTNFFPEFVSIADQYCISDQISDIYQGKSVYLYLNNGKFFFHFLI